MAAPDSTAPPAPLTNDQFRMLAVLACYGGGPDEANGGNRWLKELAFHMVIYDLIAAGHFSDYDYAPTLIDVHGVKKFAKISQEAWNDLRYLRKLRLIERVKLSTHYHDIVGAFRISREGRERLATAPDSIVEKVRSHLRCKTCRTVREPLAFGGPLPARGGAAGDDGGVIRPPGGDANEAIWLCPSCCASCLRRGPVREHDPRRCDRCPSREQLTFFNLESMRFRTRPHLPEREGVPRLPTETASASDAAAADAAAAGGGA